MKKLIAIQVMGETGKWFDSLPIIHEVEEDHIPSVMEAVSRQFGTRIRVTYPSVEGLKENNKSEDSLCNYISRLNGHYPQYEKF